MGSSLRECDKCYGVFTTLGKSRGHVYPLCMAEAELDMELAEKAGYQVTQEGLDELAKGDVGARMDHGKARIHLVPAAFIHALAVLCGMGADKYSPWNWADGMDYSRVSDCLDRHILKWKAGEDYDPDTGSHHMICAAWNAMALFCYHIWSKGNDDRYKPTESRPATQD